MKSKINITAEARSGKRVNLYFYSIKQAKFLNPGLKNFRMAS